MNLTDLTPQIANYLHDWEAHIEHTHLTTLAGPNGREMVLRIERNRLAVCGRYPRYNGEVVINDADEQPTITLNPNKAPQRLAADILRRFMPAYENMFKIATARVIGYQQHEGIVQEHTHRLSAVIGQPQNESEVYLNEYNPQNGYTLYGRFIVLGRNDITLSLNHLSLAQAMAVAQALKGQQRPAGPQYAVFYHRSPTFLDSGLNGTTRLVTSDIPHTHAFVTTVNAEGLDDVYHQLQAEWWSPNGEAKSIIESAGVSHTSLSIGDVVCDDNGNFFECVSSGWRKVEIDQPLGQCPQCDKLRVLVGERCPHCYAA